MNKSVPSLYRAGALAVLLGTVSASADLTHRYSFTTNANDSIGTAHGAAVATPNGSVPTFADGKVQLDGVGGYIDLPNNLFSTLTNVTIEIWVTADVASNWSRIFDFGTTTVGERTPEQIDGANGLDYMFLTPNGAGSGNARFTITDGTNAGERPILNDPEDFPVGEEVHVAVAYGPPVARLYVNGRLAASGTAVVPLSELVDVNNWLGRSLYQADPMFTGSYNEFRIHNSIVGGPELKASQLGGPNSTNYNPGTVTAITITGDTAMQAGGAQTPVISATFSVSGQIDLGPGEATVTSSASSVVEVAASGALLARSAGNAVITASRGGQNATLNITVSASAPAVLRHRYSFAGSGTAITDSVGSQHGEIRPPFPTAGVPNPAPVTLTNGQALLPSGVAWDSAGYIDLPNGLISSKTNITIETWVTWNGPAGGGQNWSRIFDFGDSSKGEDAQLPGNGTARSYLFLSPWANGNTVRFAAQPTGGAESQINSSPTIAVGQETHLVVVYAPTLQVSQLYVNGILRGSGAAPFALSTVADLNNWLGASQWQGDLPFFGLYNEFRIYEGARTGLEVALSRSAGPDALPPANPGTLQSLSLAPATLFVGNPTATQAALIANFQNAPNVNITGVAGTALNSSNTNVFTVSATGGLLPRSVGTASLIGTYQSLSTTSAVAVVGPTALRHQVPTTLNEGGAVVNAALFADFATQANVNVGGFSGVTRSSSNTNILTIAANGNVVPRSQGTATITSTYGGLTATTTITVAPPPPGFQQDNAGLVVMEAESFTATTAVAPDGHNWGEQTTRANASGGRYVQALPDSGGSQTTVATATANSPRLEFKVNFARTGTHYIWIRGGDPVAGGGGDSVHAGINGTIPDTSLYLGGAGAPGFNTTGWNWVGAINAGGRATVDVPSAGLHSINVFMREDGFVFDKIIVTSDEAFTPTDTGPAESARLAPPPPTGSPIANGLVAYWDFDGDLQDSIKDFHGTARGTNAIPFVNGKAGFGKAIKLNGNDQYVEITGGNENELDFAGGNMSIAGWFKVDAFDTGWQALIAKGEGTAWRVARRDPLSTLAYAGGVGEGPNDTPNVNDGRWHHFVAVTDAATNNRPFGTALYIDGRIYTINTNRAVLTGTTTNVRIGDNPGAPAREWEGELDDIGLWSRVLAPDEVATLYNNGLGNPVSVFLPNQPPPVSITNNLVAYWDFEGDLQDLVKDFHGTARGTNAIPFVDGKVGFGKAIKLDGGNQYVEITGGNENELDFAGGNLSIAGWFKVDAFDTGWQALIAKGEGTAWRVARRDPTDTIAYAGGVGEGPNDTPNVRDGQWHHFVAVTDAATNNRAFGTALYIDGQIYSINTNRAVLTGTTTNVRIGDNPGAPAREWEGEIDDVALWSRVLTGGEVAALNALGPGKPLSALFPGATVEPNRIGLNFGANEYPTLIGAGKLAAASVAGVPAVAQQNWNNLDPQNGTNTTIVADANGTSVPTTAGVVWTSNGLWANTGRGENNNAFPTNTPNRIFMTGYLDTGNATTTVVTITNIPASIASGYDVYVYAQGGVPGRGGAYRILDAGNTNTVLKDYVRAQSPVATNATNFVRVPVPAPGTNTHGAGNYIVFSGLTASSIRIEATTASGQAFGGTPRAPINAVQLVKAAAAPPAGPSISIARNATGVPVITYTGTLQSATSVTGPYTNVTGATSPFTVNPADPARFYRASQP